MILPVIAILAGLALLVWSADRFVDGAAATARYFGMSPLLIGMVIVGFGTSAPEMVVSALAASSGNPNIALGNAYGSNIANIGLILAVTALIGPIAVHSQVLRKELPILTAVTLFAVWQLWDGTITRLDAVLMFVVFAGIMVWSVRQDRNKSDSLSGEMERELQEHAMPLSHALTWVVIGLLLLIAASRALVWGAVEVARGFGVSDLVIGLTIVAVGTSLPELASSITAARKGEHDIALGNVLGSNLFNTLVVVGIAGLISPLTVDAAFLSRDMPVLVLFTVSLFVFCYGFRGPGRITRPEALILLAAYVAYTVVLARSAGAT